MPLPDCGAVLRREVGRSGPWDTGRGHKLDLLLCPDSGRMAINRAYLHHKSCCQLVPRIRFGVRKLLTARSPGRSGKVWGTWQLGSRPGYRWNHAWHRCCVGQDYRTVKRCRPGV
ncbi:hypothetical protein BAUCODRAFT_268989 [Baudoinia panamericana UAMH 10762]|uniref:Uncharacterized protein n=1 Tax=Baudoinia panamericana (strain UAMH 10762) TaxID=717646 RepID=M2M9A5_BAUPA|nr:uncharacterized protein BAUCODRAFT_268989 [Baudoinia panamericana UAMH 10762]EMC92971.1 hypothetical protein BAUCODRAFT_268989 [Baudoinia panamericana UAMH 10762]